MSKIVGSGRTSISLGGTSGGAVLTFLGGRRGAYAGGGVAGSNLVLSDKSMGMIWGSPTYHLTDCVRR